MKAILTGDIIGSTMIPIEQRKILLDTLDSAAIFLKKFSPLKYEIFRGDSFQFIIDKPEQSLTIAIMIRAFLRKGTPIGNKNIWDARIAIGIGDVTYLSKNIVTSDGEAFLLSGRGFDKLGKANLGIYTKWENINEEMEITTSFADDIISNWSCNQAKLIVYSIGNGLLQKEISKIIGKTRQNVNKTLAAAKDNLIKMYIKRFEKIILSKITEP